MEDVVIVEATRTPIGAYLGALQGVAAPRLGAAAIKAALERAQVNPDWVEECLMGCVLPAGIGQAPARQAALFAGLPQSVRCTTVNRVCGSGLKAVMLAAQMIQTGDATWVVAGGMENMSQVPYLVPRARQGYRLGHDTFVDGLIHDGLWDVYGNKHMGQCAELCATERKFTREAQDDFARQSYERALNAIQSGLFKAESVSIEAKAGKQTTLVEHDEEPSRGRLDKFSDLRPAFDKAGTVTAANSSSLNDGASALILTTAREAKEKGIRPMARLIAQASHAQAPEWFTTAPVAAIQKLLKVAGRSVEQVDLFEINEAFAVVALACAAELELPMDRLNIRGGAVALGHPIGASGARILTTLVHALKQTQKKVGVAAICIGGGEASAVLVEAM